MPLGKQRLLFLELEHSGFALGQPGEAGRLVLHVLKGSSELKWRCQLVDELMRGFIAARIDRSILLSACEEMARLGCPSASALSELVER